MNPHLPLPADRVDSAGRCPAREMGLGITCSVRSSPQGVTIACRRSATLARRKPMLSLRLPGLLLLRLADRRLPASLL